jgi:hypothetical protein
MDHYVCTKDNSILPNYSDFKKMNEINIEIPMLLNSQLIQKELFLIDSKVLHLQINNSSNNKIDLESNYGNYSYEKVFKSSFKHMINCLIPLLKKKPVFFGIVNFTTFDKKYLNEFEENNSIHHNEVNLYRKNYLDNIELIEYILSDNVDSLEMGKKIWDIKDIREIKEKNRI